MKATRQYLPEHLPTRDSRKGDVNVEGGVDELLIPALADRISKLAGMSSCSVATENAAPLISYYVDSAIAAEQQADAPMLFAMLDSSGRVTITVVPEDLVEIIRKGWAVADADQITTYPPRNKAELEILWRIIQMAYSAITRQLISAATEPGKPDSRHSSSPVVAARTPVASGVSF